MVLHLRPARDYVAGNLEPGTLPTSLLRADPRSDGSTRGSCGTRGRLERIKAGDCDETFVSLASVVSLYGNTACKGGGARRNLRHDGPCRKVEGGKRKERARWKSGGGTNASLWAPFPATAGGEGVRWLIGGAAAKNS